MIIDAADRKESLKRFFVKIETFRRISDVLDAAFGFVCAFFILRTVSLFEFGAYQLVLSIISILGSFNVMDIFDSFIATELRHHFNNGRLGQAKRLFLESAAVKVGVGLLLATALFFAAHAVSDHFGKDVAGYVQIAIFIFLGNVFGTVIRNLLKAVESYVFWVFPAIKEGIRMLFIIVLAVTGNLGLGEVIVAHAAAEVTATLLIGITTFFRVYIKAFRKAESVPGGLLFPLLKSYGKLSVVRFVCSKIASSAMPWFIKTLVNTEGVALYTLAKGAIDLVENVLPTSGISSLLVLQAKEKDTVPMSIIFRRAVKYTFWGGTVLMILGLTILPIPLVWVFPKYAPAIPLFRVMLLVMPIYGIYKVIKATIMALRELPILFKKSMNEALITVTFGPVFLYLFGLVGAALVFVLIYVERMFYFYPALTNKHTYLKIPLRKLFIIDSYDRDAVKKVFSLASHSFRFFSGRGK